MNDYMTLLHKHKINGGFLAPDRIPMEERNKNEMILELQNEVHTKDKEIERLQKELEFEKSKNNEVREYLRKKSMIVQLDNKIDFAIDLYLKEPEYKELLEILDKGCDSNE